MENLKHPNTKKTGLVDLSEYDTIFCDSLQALEWAYKNGLSNKATVKASAPAVLWTRKACVHNVEARWTIGEINKFHDTILKLTEDIFDSVLYVTDGVERELALTISRFSQQFQKLLYKAACLEESDFTDSRLFIRVEGKTGPEGNMMNSPWDQLLSCNPLFSTVDYALKNDEWSVLTTHGVSYWKRLNIAGYRTIIYRLAVKLMKKLPDWMFTKELLMPNENELNIEIASSLALHGVKITKIQPKTVSGAKNIVLSGNIEACYKVVLPIMRKRVEQWVVPSAVEITMSLFESYLEKQLNQFVLLVNGWGKVITKKSKIKQSILVNAAGNMNGHALAYICRKNNIPLMSSQHGVTVEISKAHNIYNIVFDNSVVDAVFSYNTSIVDIEQSIHFDHAKHYVVGMPMRLIGMKYKKYIDKSVPPVVYISTNLYHMGFSISLKTDYINARDEQKIIKKVLSKLPHKVRYKTYPEDNRRYADVDPVLNDVENANNIDVFSDKVDMRYLISEHSILVTTGATSTLGWPIMSEKPVVFIDNKNKSPLTDDAHKSLSEGIFIFNSEDPNFHEKLKDFLSQPIDTIEQLWFSKKHARKKMIRKYFSEYEGGAGERATKIILKEYLS